MKFIQILETWPYWSSEFVATQIQRRTKTPNYFIHESCLKSGKLKEGISNEIFMSIRLS